MKTQDVKKKVAAKVAKGKEKVAAKCGRAKAATVAAAAVIAAAAALTGCSTADAPTAQRAQTVTAKDVTITLNVCGTNCTPSVTLEIATAAQANETAGAETMTATATQTPTTHVPTDLKFTYGLASDTAGGTSWIDSLTSASAQGLAAWLKSGNANGTMTVTKADGTTETVTCKDGKCTTSSGGDCITCGDCGT